MTLAIIICQVNASCALLYAWARSICRGKPSGSVAKGPGYKLCKIIADVTRCGIVANEEDGVRVERDLGIEAFQVSVSEASREGWERLVK